MNIISQLKRHEGFRSQIYYCSAGKPTIGYGTNLDAGISKVQAETLLELEVAKIKMQLRESISYWDSLSEARQGVLINMAYNLGVAGLFRFKKMFAALQRHDYKRAAREILDSRAARELTSRYKELAEQMECG